MFTLSHYSPIFGVISVFTRCIRPGLDLIPKDSDPDTLVFY